MFLIFELLFILLLTMVLFTLHINERLSSRDRSPRAIVKEYWDGRERRSHARFKKDLEVEYAVEKRPHLKNNGKTVDISEGGMKLLLDEKLEKGAVLYLKVDLEDSNKTIEVEGEVAWSEEVAGEPSSGKRLFYSGIKFINIKEPSDKHLSDYIRSLASS